MALVLQVFMIRGEPRKTRSNDGKFLHELVQWSIQWFLQHTNTKRRRCLRVVWTATVDRVHGIVVSTAGSRIHHDVRRTIAVQSIVSRQQRFFKHVRSTRERPWSIRGFTPVQHASLRLSFAWTGNASFSTPSAQSQLLHSRFLNSSWFCATKSHAATTVQSRTVPTCITVPRLSWHGTTR